MALHVSSDRQLNVFILSRVARAGFAMVYPGAKTHQVAVIRYGFYKIVTNDTLPDDNWSSVYD
jgi:hypothetical protein